MNIVNECRPRVDGNGLLPSSLPDLGSGSAVIIFLGMPQAVYVSLHFRKIACDKSN